MNDRGADRGAAKVIGLTGGIASGKSLVARFLREMGAHVIDADAVAREVVAPGTEALREIVRAFGASVVTEGGVLDRKALGALVFADPGARARLNAITHPRIRARIEEEIKTARAARPGALIVVEAPLLLDVAQPEPFAPDGVVVVFADEATQIARLMARDGIPLEAAQQRLRAQRPLREKIPLATWVVDNSGSPNATRRQIEALWQAWHAREHGAGS